MNVSKYVLIFKVWVEIFILYSIFFIFQQNYFKKDPKFHLCPLCYEKVTASSFTKFNGLFSYVKLVNVPILLRHDTINKQISPDQKSLILFGYPRFLKLPTDVCATDLFELVTQVVPQGEYSLHKGRSQVKTFIVFPI